MNKYEQEISELQQRLLEAKALNVPIQQLSDGYHTFNELYAYRKAYNALLFNEWGATIVSPPGEEIRVRYDVHKSKKHSDGEPCFDGTYFVVVAMLPTGQISNHYKMKYWDDFKIPEYEKAKYPYDGHSSKDALKRMEYLLK